MAALTGCALLSNRAGDGEVPPAEEPASEGPSDEPIEQPAEELLPCPKAGGTIMLKFSAELHFNAGGADLRHSLHDGLLTMYVPGDDETGTAIRSVDQPQIPYEMNGTMGPCTIEGSGIMRPEAHGYCEAGVVYLAITEDWGPYKGTMKCEDSIIPIDYPPLGTMVHTGSDGRGEAFPLGTDFSPEGAGYTSMRPFAAGSGEHIWTIFVDELAPVPLVPQD
jgi:hypothetical protein